MNLENNDVFGIKVELFEPRMHTKSNYIFEGISVVNVTNPEE